jgi:hypothetical protein
MIVDVYVALFRHWLLKFGTMTSNHVAAAKQNDARYNGHVGFKASSNQTDQSPVAVEPPFQKLNDHQFLNSSMTSL